MFKNNPGCGCCGTSFFPCEYCQPSPLSAVKVVIPSLVDDNCNPSGGRGCADLPSGTFTLDTNVGNCQICYEESDLFPGEFWCIDDHVDLTICLSVIKNGDALRLNYLVEDELGANLLAVLWAGESLDENDEIDCSAGQDLTLPYDSILPVSFTPCAVTGGPDDATVFAS